MERKIKLRWCSSGESRLNSPNWAVSVIIMLMKPSNELAHCTQMLIVLCCPEPYIIQDYCSPPVPQQLCPYQHLCWALWPMQRNGALQNLPALVTTTATLLPLPYKGGFRPNVKPIFRGAGLTLPCEVHTDVKMHERSICQECMAPLQKHAVS